LIIKFDRKLLFCEGRKELMIDDGSKDILVSPLQKKKHLYQIIQYRLALMRKCHTNFKLQKISANLEKN